MTEKEKKQKRLTIATKIERLTRKIVERGKEIRRLKRLIAFDADSRKNAGIYRNWKEGAEKSLISTRKKIYKLTELLKTI